MFEYTIDPQTLLIHSEEKNNDGTITFNPNDDNNNNEQHTSSSTRLAQETGDALATCSTGDEMNDFLSCEIEKSIESLSLPCAAGTLRLDHREAKKEERGWRSDFNLRS